MPVADAPHLRQAPLRINLGLRLTEEDYLKVQQCAQAWQCTAGEAVRRLLRTVWQAHETRLAARTAQASSEQMSSSSFGSPQCEKR
jgi:hypothetical protein